MSPTGKKPSSVGEPFDCVIRLTIPPNGSMPTFLIARVRYKDVILGEFIPDPHFINN